MLSEALREKIMKGIAQFYKDYPMEMVNDLHIHHYGNDYRIEENEWAFSVFRSYENSITDDYICAIPSQEIERYLRIQKV